MVSYLAYKTVHLVGVFLVLMSLGSMAFYLINGGTGKPVQRRFLALAHGIGLLAVLLGGFGMIARLRIEWPWPGWIFAKILIWLLLGGMLAMIPRRPRQAGLLWWACAGLGLVAAMLALYKPF
jgi:hypothetical protein